MNDIGIIRKPKDFILGLLYILGGIALALVARTYTVGTLRDMGPGCLPLILAGCLAGLGLILLVQSFAGDRDKMNRVFSRPLLMISGSVILFGLLIRPAGAVVAIAVLIAGAAFAHPKHTPATAAGTAIALAAGSILLFVILLGQQIPVLGYWFAS